MGKHEGAPKKYKKFVPANPDSKDGDSSGGGDGKHSGGKGDNGGNEDNGGKK